MNENKVPHTVVPQEEVEKMADKYVDSFFLTDREYHKLKRNSCTPQKAYIAGYNAANAAIQSQSAEVDDAQSQLEGDIAAFEKFEKEYKELADTTAYAYYVFRAGLSHARSQSQHVPTGSVREEIGKAYDAGHADTSSESSIGKAQYLNQYDIEVPTSGSVREIADIKIPVDGKWVSIEEFSNSAAKNLPVVCSTGWTDADMCKFFNEAKKGKDGSAKNQLKKYKLSHPIQVDSRIKANK